jgi:nucleotide-binding universal stress UspA family protein
MTGTSDGIRLSTLLFATDLGPDSAPALAHSRLLAAHFGARLVLYHAVPVPEHRFAHWAFAHGHEVWVSAERHARAELERQAEGLACEHELVVERRPSPLDGILEAIRLRRPDLVVLGTHGREGLGHLLLGSVTEAVMHESHRVPLLCIPSRAPAPAGPYQRILVPTDFSPVSRRAFPMAAFLGRAFEAEVIALHVVGRARSLLGPLPEDLGRAAEQSLREFVHEDLGDLRLSVAVRTGHVWERIAHAASALKDGLVVMSTSGEDSFKDHILGSNTERVVRHAPCPVLVI